MTIVIIVMGITFICELIAYLLQIAMFGMQIEVLALLNTLGIEILYNTLVAIIIYPILRSGGELAQRIFTEKKILTRYY